MKRFIVSSTNNKFEFEKINYRNYYKIAEYL